MPLLLPLYTNKIMLKINKELEKIIEDEFDCLINDLGCLTGEEWIAESIKEVVNQSFILGGVRKCYCPKESDDFYDEYGNLVGWGCLGCGFIGE